jgi:hypothetical protein
MPHNLKIKHLRLCYHNVSAPASRFQHLPRGHRERERKSVFDCGQQLQPISSCQEQSLMFAYYKIMLINYYQKECWLVV